MNLINKIAKHSIFLVVICLAVSACQKMERPELKELILDPPPPPYSILKNFWSFDGNTRDTGQYRAVTTSKNITFVTGVNGQAAKIGTDGYVLVANVADSIKTPGSFTIAFWMNGVGPVQGGAQGLFAIANKNEFWGNLEMFLENLNNGSEAYLKVHMFNSGAADGKGEQWNEVKIANGLNKWTHIAVTYNAADSKFSIYADGQPTTVANKILTDATGTTPKPYGPVTFKDVSGMVIGTYAFQTSPSLTNHGPESWAKSFNGALDQFRVYNVALSAAEVNNLFTTKQ